MFWSERVTEAYVGVKSCMDVGNLTGVCHVYFLQNKVSY